MSASLDVIKAEVLDCSNCNLRSMKYKPVPGVGPEQVDLVIVGEAAGSNELEQGEPFVGKAGFLLNQCLKEAGIDRKKVYITNVVKCRPHNGSADRPPSKKEIKACQNYLMRELAELKPKMVILLGNTPLSVFSRKSKIGEMRGMAFEANGMTFFPTYHPSYILRMPSYRHVLVGDLKRAVQVMNGDVLEVNIEENVVVCLTEEEANKQVDLALEAEYNSADVETTGLLAWSKSDQILCIGFAYAKDKAFVVPFTEWGKRAIRRLCESDDVKKVMHNGKFDKTFIEKYGVKVRRFVFDTKLAAHLLDENRNSALEPLAIEVLGAKPWKNTATFSDWEGYQGTVEEILAEPVLVDNPSTQDLDDYQAKVRGRERFLQLMRYNGVDVIMTFNLYDVLKPELIKNDKLLKIFTQITMPISRVLQVVEEVGMMVDVPYIEKLKVETQKVIDTSMGKMSEAIPEFYKQQKEQEYVDGLWEKYSTQKTIITKAEKYGVPLAEMVGAKVHEVLSDKPYQFEFNWNSGDQLADLFFTPYGLNLTPFGTTDSGKPSTNEDSLKAIAEKYGKSAELIQALLDYRGVKKLITTYYDPWLNSRDENDRVHTKFKIDGTATGRLSSAEPLNLQNVPRGKEVRNCFIAAPGWKLIQADYSQLELRVAAQVAPESTMRQAYIDGIDLHTQTAMGITGRDEKYIKENKKFRTYAKAVNFGFLYGMGAAGFVAYAKSNYGLNISLEEAQLFRDRFFMTYPGLVDWHGRMRGTIIKQKCVETVFGRKRRLPEAASMEMGVRNAAIREGTNMVVQSVAADITLMSLINLHEIFDPEIARITSTVHDSIMVEVREEYADMVASIIKETMENPPIEDLFNYTWRVPLVADVSIGNRWGEL